MFEASQKDIFLVAIVAVHQLCIQYLDKTDIKENGSVRLKKYKITESIKYSANIVETVQKKILEKFIRYSDLKSRFICWNVSTVKWNDLIK